MNLVEVTNLRRPVLSERHLQRVGKEFEALTVEQQQRLSELRLGEHQARGAVLAYLDMVQRAMQDSGWSQEDLATEMKISAQAVSEWFLTGEISGKYLAQLLSAEFLAISEPASVVECDVHGYRTAIRWVRREVLRVKRTPNHLPSWKELVFLIYAHTDEVAQGSPSVGCLPVGVQRHYHSWRRRSGPRKQSRFERVQEKWGLTYRLFAFQEYYRDKQ